ncbi:phosphopentomutase [Natranaerovirga pectinivora]|uniref:Phosphopentomutase n=1 Tax=Natranaerovirga pectinivora TaxID=682400 RepID=A0A4R3MNR0_9FIRM|nr:phosphopentomutase [Natranaerovirga pectinivora]TCT15020.1 phosphopentomutase [Natranaerovirga pectinivora]
MEKRIIWIILDSVGMGELPDAHEFGDVGSNTIGNISKAIGGLKIPNMIKLGLGNIDNIKGLNRSINPAGVFARVAEKSKGKDTTTGHWEMVGVYSENGFPIYPEGFPTEIINPFKEAIGTEILGNYAASGTEIIKELGEEHIKTGYPIIYTSADSVFQIAAHEDIIPLERLYEICQIAREQLVGINAVARVIARPFNGEVGNFSRTANRKDFSLEPPAGTLLDHIKEANLDVIGIGKIEDIFAKKGITKAIHTKDNMDGVNKTIEYIKKDTKGLIFTNLVDFDSKYGHRNDHIGYANALEEFDGRIPEIIDAMKDNDILFIMADHGCDPTTESTDHSREFVPFVGYGLSLKRDVNLGTRLTFADIGQTIGEILNVKPISLGESFANEIIGGYIDEKH